MNRTIEMKWSMMLACFFNLKGEGGGEETSNQSQIKHQTSYYFSIFFLRFFKKTAKLLSNFHQLDRYLCKLYILSSKLKPHKLFFWKFQGVSSNFLWDFSNLKSRKLRKVILWIIQQRKRPTNNPTTCALEWNMLESAICFSTPSFSIF